MTEYTTQRGEYKGNALLEIHANGRRILSFGQRKAEAIIEVFGEIEDFALEREQALKANAIREQATAT